MYDLHEFLHFKKNLFLHEIFPFLIRYESLIQMGSKSKSLIDNGWFPYLEEISMIFCCNFWDFNAKVKIRRKNYILGIIFESSYREEIFLSEMNLRSCWDKPSIYLLYEIFLSILFTVWACPARCHFWAKLKLSTSHQPL